MAHSPARRPFAFTTPSSDPAEYSSAAISPSVTQLDPSDWKIHGASPLKRPITVVSCPDCLKPILQSTLADHAVTCRNIRQGTYEVPKIGKREVEDDAPLSDIRKRRRSELSPSPSSPPLSSTTKKSRTDASSPARSDVSKAHSSVPPPKNPKTKKQQEKERKEEKKAMAIDLSRHCGVINAKNLPCVRSLTCKSHSMGAKRDVPGRPRPYDELLLEWNRAHNPKFVEPKNKLKKRLAANGAVDPGSIGDPAGPRTGEGPEAVGDLSGALKKKKKAKTSVGMNGNGGKKDEEEAGWSLTTELDLLINAAKVARSNLSSPRLSSAGSSSSTQSSQQTDPSVDPLLLLPLPRPSTLAVPPPRVGRSLPREGMKVGLYSRRREEVKKLSGLLSLIG